MSPNKTFLLLFLLACDRVTDVRLHVKVDVASPVYDDGLYRCNACWLQGRGFLWVASSLATTDKWDSSTVWTPWVCNTGTVQLAVWLRDMTVPVWWLRQPGNFASCSYLELFLLYSSLSGWYRVWRPLNSYIVLILLHPVSMSSSYTSSRFHPCFLICPHWIRGLAQSLLPVKAAFSFLSPRSLQNLAPYTFMEWIATCSDPMVCEK